MNKKLFEDLYYGDYSPNDVTIKSKEYDMLLKKAVKIQEQLRSKLSPSDYKLVVKLDCLHNQLSDFFGKQAYSDGIKFATNFLYNALSSNNSEKK